MHVQSSVKKRCPKCQIIRRGLVVYVMCKDKRRHNQRQGTKIRKKAG